jgi:hypothetical protein
MTLKITLITPPDIFENDSPSIFLINLTEKQQEQASDWLAKSSGEFPLNVYFFQNEPNIVWFFHALANSSHKYINLDNTVGMCELLSSYILSKPSVYYSSTDKNKIAVFGHINQNKIESVTDFFERLMSEKFE